MVLLVSLELKVCKGLQDLKGLKDLAEAVVELPPEERRRPLTLALLDAVRGAAGRARGGPAAE